MSADHDALLDAWLDGDLDEVGASRLRAALDGDPALRRRLVELAWLEADLGRPRAGRRKRPLRLRPMLRWAAAAAVLAIAINGWWFSRRPAESPPDAAEIVAGALSGASGPLLRLAYGQQAQAADTSEAVLRLRDGSLVTVAGGARILLREPGAGERVAVQLLDGAVRCDVARTAGRFSVETPLGRVSVLGTVFRVAYRPGGGDENLEVAVERGRVRVEHAGGSEELVAGALRRYVRPAPPPQTHVVQGRLKSVEADALVIETGDGGRSTRVPLAPTAQILRDGQPTTLTTIAPRASLLVSVDGDGTAWRVEAVGERLVGVIESVDLPGLRLTLAPREGRRREIALLPSTRVQREGADAAPADLRPGDEVRLLLTTDGRSALEAGVGRPPRTAR